MPVAGNTTSRGDSTVYPMKGDTIRDPQTQWCTYPYLLTKMLILFIPLFIVTLPIAILARIYAAFLPTPTDKVKRAAPGFALFVLLSSPFVLVVLVFVALSRASDGFFYYLFGVPYMLLSKDGWGRRKRSIATIRPYMGGPRIRILDVLVCALGHTLRNGFLEWCWCFAVMIIAIPWMKYWVNANTLVYDLSERYVQQISTSMTDCGVDSVQDSARRIISRTKQDKDFQNRLDLWNFCPHYP